MTAHGFRATASTLLNESGRFSADAIERALAHQDPDPVRRAYSRGSFWKEGVEMAQWWSHHLDTLRKGGDAKLEQRTSPAAFDVAGLLVARSAMALNDAIICAGLAGGIG